MKTHFLLFSFLCIFACSVQAQNQQHNAIIKSCSERVGTYFNSSRSRFTSNHVMVPQKRNLFNPSNSVWKWDTILCYDTSSSQKPFQRVSRTYNSLGEVLTQFTERSQSGFIWENYARETFTYDSTGNLVADLAETWQNNAWVNYMKQEFVYNANGDEVDWKREGWVSNAWANWWHYYWHFDSNGLNDTCIYQVGQDTLWVNFMLGISSYDSNGYMTGYINNTWINNGWEVSNRGTWTYDSNGNCLMRLEQNWVNSSWVNNSLVILTYDTAGHCLSTVSQQWQNNAWVNTESRSYAYDASGNKIMNLDQHWSGGSWVNNNQSLYVYDASNNMLSETYQIWDNSSWLNQNTEQYTYDSWGNSLTGKYLIWYQNAWHHFDGSLYVFADHQRDGMVDFQEVYRYSAVIDSIILLIEPARSPLQVTLFPNPARSVVYVSTGTDSNNSCSSIAIYNLQGQLLLTKQLVNSTTGVDITDLKPGIYFVRFSGNQMTRVLKFIKD